MYSKSLACLLPLLLFSQILLAQPISADTSANDKGRWQLQSLSIAYAGENLIRPGLQFSAEFIPFKKKVHELKLAPVATFFVFRPFYTSLLLGGRAMYQVHFRNGLTLRALGINASYKHKFLMADVYEVQDGQVRETGW